MQPFMLPSLFAVSAVSEVGVLSRQDNKRNYNLGTMHSTPRSPDLEFAEVPKLHPLQILVLDDHVGATIL
jgi:hypothetical protein